MTRREARQRIGSRTSRRRDLKAQLRHKRSAFVIFPREKLRRLLEKQQ